MGPVPEWVCAMSEQDTANPQVQAVKDAIDASLLETAADTDVDVDDVVLTKLDQHGDYSPATVANFAQAEIRSRVEAEKAETLKGIIMGCRDRHGRNWPRQHSLVRSSGDHAQVSVWDGTLPNPQGNEVAMPAGGAIVNIECTFDEEYESYEGQRLTSVKDLDKEGLVENLSKVAVDPSDLTASDEYEIVVIRGTVQDVEPQTIFVNGEPDHDGDVLMTDERGDLQPHFEVRLERDGGTFLRGHVERQAYGKPYFVAEDLLAVCGDAYEQFDDPSSQANYVSKALENRDVLLVGNVNAFNRDRDGEGDPVTYIDLGLSALVTAGTEAQQRVTDVEQEDPEEPEEPEGRDVDEVREDIEQYASLVGIDVDELTVEDVNENLDIDADDVTIRAALEGVETGEGEEDEEPEEESIGDILAPLKEGDSYNCPVEDCLVQAGSAGELLGHAQTEHGIDKEPKAAARDLADR